MYIYTHTHNISCLRVKQQYIALDKSRPGYLMCRTPLIFHFKNKSFIFRLYFHQLRHAAGGAVG